MYKYPKHLLDRLEELIDTLILDAGHGVMEVTTYM